MSGDFQIGEWNVQPAVNRLKRGDQVVRLEPKVMQVLVCLAESSGEVVTREQLIARVWPDVFVTDDVLHRAIRELRRVFGDSPSSPRYIETIRKRGYRLLPASGPARFDEAASAIVRAENAEKGRGLSPKTGTDPANLDPASPEVGTDTGGARGEAGRTAVTRFGVFALPAAVAVVVAVAMVASRAGDLAPQAHARFVPMVSGPLNESDPAVSPDGRHIAFVQREAGADGSADIYIRTLGDGRVTRITSDPASDRLPAWSPDSSRLAFIRTTADTCRIVLRALAASADTVLGPCGNADEPRLAWTADGLALITSQSAPPHAPFAARLTRVDVTTAATTMLTDPSRGIVGDHSPAVSPDGREVAFIRHVSGGVADIYIAAINGSHVRRVTFDEADLTGIDWSADGRSIVYSSDRAGGYSLWRVPAAGGAPVLLAGGAARMKHPVTDRRGGRVVYENWHYEINVWRIESRQGSEGREAPVTRTSDIWNLYPQISPDGGQLAYVSTQSGTHELWVAERDGSNPRQLTRVDGGIVKVPRWSPAGTHIVYLARGRDAVDVHHVEVSTGRVTRLTHDAINELAPAWTHDGTRVLFGALDADGHSNVWSVDAATGSDRRVEIANAVAAQPAVDGSGLFFTRPDASGVWRTASDAASPRRVVSSVARGNSLGWVAAGESIYYIAEDGDSIQLRRQSSNAAESTWVAALSQFSWPGFSVSRDGVVYYSRWDRRDSNLMAIE